MSSKKNSKKQKGGRRIRRSQPQSQQRNNTLKNFRPGNLKQLMSTSSKPKKTEPIKFYKKDYDYGSKDLGQTTGEPNIDPLSKMIRAQALKKKQELLSDSTTERSKNPSERTTPTDGGSVPRISPRAYSIPPLPPGDPEAVGIEVRATNYIEHAFRVPPQ